MDIFVLLAALWRGISLGLLLTIMAGPILFALLETGVERGIRSGVALASGEWVSDGIYIAAIYLGILTVRKGADEAAFKLWLGLLGGVILAVFGLVALFSKPKAATGNHAVTAANLWGYFLKGFTINTLNPFTVIFWIGVTSTVVVAGHYSTAQAVTFYAGVIGTIVVADILKIWLAKSIRPWLKPAYLLWLRRISGAVFVVFGVVMILRVTVWH